MGFEDAIKLLLVSFDSTLKANLTVGAPFDFHVYRAGSCHLGERGRITADDPYFQAVSQGWSDALKHALDRLPPFAFDPS